MPEIKIRIPTNAGILRRKPQLIEHALSFSKLNVKSVYNYKKVVIQAKINLESVITACQKQ